jgi:FSR family fosmidomycin resistance protein-like MFS transporter
LLGVATGYAVLLPLIVVMGLGVAAYHPEGYKTATAVAGDRKATALSWFSLGGNVGIALGAPLMTALVTGFGLGGSLGIVVPSAIMAALLVAVLPRLQAVPASRAPTRTVVDGRQSMPGAMGLLILVVAIRSWTSLGFTTFVPLYYVDQLKSDPRLVGVLLFVFLGAGALGTVVAGPIADRIGTRPFITWVFVLTAPLAVLFVLSAGTPLAFVLLGLVGAVLVSSFSVAVVLGQAYMPRHAGTASGLIVGFAIGAGGLGVWLLGAVADRYGLPAALWISAVMPVAGGVAATFLPAPRDRA